MKRYRNENGQLLKSIDQIAKLTEEEGRSYYVTGGIFLNTADNREYVNISETNETLAHFQSFDGYNLFIPSEKLGTFLPDVASDGMELIRVE